VRREVVDLVLLVVRVGRAMQSLFPEAILKEPEERVWPTEISLIISASAWNQATSGT
jgi:hypothetical protein